MTPFNENNLTLSDQWTENCMNDQCNVLFLSIFAIIMPKPKSVAIWGPQDPFPFYDEQKWHEDADHFGNIIEQMRLDLIQDYNLTVTIFCSKWDLEKGLTTIF